MRPKTRAKVRKPDRKPHIALFPNVEGKLVYDIVCSFRAELDDPAFVFCDRLNERDGRYI